LSVIYLGEITLFTNSIAVATTTGTQISLNLGRTILGFFSLLWMHIL